MARTNEIYQTERTPIIEFLNLRNRDGWPKADSSKCSVFEAIELVGSATFGPDWTGEELHSLHWFVAPKVAEDERLRRMNMPAPINSGGGAGIVRRFEPPPPPQRQHVVDWIDHISETRRAEAVASEQELWEANRALASRLTNVFDWIASKCRDGELASFCRFKTGGQIMPVGPHEWNIEFPIARFLAKGSYSRWFVNVQPPKQWDVYMFFDRTNLQQAIVSLAHSPVVVPVHAIDALSPYLKLAVKLALAKGYISEADDETQPVREAEVKAAWDEALPDVPWSETAGQAIAKVMGFPNANAIRQGRQARLAEKGG